ncbi:acyl carrier protein [Streptomyces cyaneofuscatus]|uniref:acyl carrier protein n=1 Tax=Streptomyces cyaneofuscatus TaxID=66883 RepID=UPI0037879424
MTEITPDLILECISKVFHRELDEDTDIFEAGVDSLVVLRVRALIKQQTGVKVPGHVFFDGRTPALIARKAGALHAGG